MSPPKLPTNGIAQAIYTWSSTTVTGAAGLGFAEISPSLRAAIAWLERFQPPAFKVPLESSLAADAGAHSEFSHVGRIRHDGVDIVFCKTANALLDEKGRPATLVHALLARAPRFGLEAIRFIPSSLWIRRPVGGALTPLNDLDWQDLAVDDMCTESLAAHDCAVDDARALHLLALLGASAETTRAQGVADYYDAIVDDLLRALPPTLWPAVGLEPFLHDGRAVARITVDMMAISVDERTGDRPSCNIAVRAAAAVPQLTRPGGFAAFAAAMTGERTAPTVANAAAPAVSLSRDVSAALAAAVRAVCEEAGNPTRTVSPQEAQLVAHRLRQQGLSVAAAVSQASPAVVIDVLATTRDRFDVADWVSAVAPLSDRQVGALWRSTGVAVFLAAALGRLGRGGNPGRLAAAPGANGAATSAVLAQAAIQPAAPATLGAAFHAGLAGTERARRFLARVFADQPSLLFGGILEHAELPLPDHLDFVRSAYAELCRYHGLPPRTVEAVEELLRPGILRRARRRAASAPIGDLVRRLPR